MLHHHVVRGLHPVFRLETKANQLFDAFIASDQTEILVEIFPIKGHREMPGARTSHRERLVKNTVAETIWVIVTTLLDDKKYPIEHLSDLYHGHWGLEELYKTSKQLMAVEQFHSRNKRGGKQEIFAHFILMTLTRVFTKHAEDQLNFKADTEKPPMQDNF